MNTGPVAGEEEPDECQRIRSFRRTGCRTHNASAGAGLQNPFRAESLEVAPPDGRRLAMRPVPTRNDDLDARAPRRRQRAPRQAAVSPGLVCAVRIRVA